MSNGKLNAKRIDNEALTAKELEHPTLLVLLNLIRYTFTESLRTPLGKVMFSAFILIMIWGQHGEFELLGLFFPAWKGIGEAAYGCVATTASCSRPIFIPGLGWDLELVSFSAGFTLLVVVPCILIKFWLKEPLAAFGLAFPPPERRRLAVMGFLLLTFISLPAFLIAAHQHSMSTLYPYYRHFTGWGDYAAYEMITVLFYAAIEFVFRGYLLFGGGRYEATYNQSISNFPKFTLLIQMLSYTAWHLGKPLPELWGTLLWGITAGAIAYACRSVWPVLASHWVLNVIMDTGILRSQHLAPFH